MKLKFIYMRLKMESKNRICLIKVHAMFLLYVDVSSQGNFNIQTMRPHK